ncbi:YceI family protein [Ancylomarina longa]|uniref:YceI family protein n=1 Tax=Ancylomarina longa TaxID=2487017 RepID=A0A434AGY7_9BACT|nr:YceI family protein [Ancylomarina longa]RUT73640.1 YceI family protein [Ancylomarina longa]
MRRKSLIIASILLFSTFLLSSSSFAQVKSFIVNPEKSIVNWHGKKVTGEHLGTINVSKGNLVLQDDQIKAADFIVDMKSIANTDLKDPGYKAKLEGHLKSDDFFGVEKYPESEFILTESKKLADGSYDVKGNITIKGISNPIEFKVMLEKQNEVVHVSGKVVIDRSKFNVRYGSGSFFDNLGDKTIYDDFELDLDLILQ